MKKQHETFVNAMAQHGDPVMAYKTAYPHVKESSARAAACRLLQHPEIAKAVAYDAKLIHQKAKAAVLQQGRQRVARQLADLQSRREVLAAMIFGEFKRKRIFKLNGQLVEAEEDIPAHSVLRAIELDCKLEAGFDWTGVRRTAAKKEKEAPPKAGPHNPIAPASEEITGSIVLTGDTLFEKRDAAWIERYIAWKKQNPDKVKEWVVEVENIRTDTYIEWDEDTEGFPRCSPQHKGSRSLVQVVRFGDGRPGGPFIPGQSRYFTSYEEENAYHGNSSEQIPNSNDSNPDDSNSRFQIPDPNDPNPNEQSAAGRMNSPLEGGRSVADGTGGCADNTSHPAPPPGGGREGQQSVTFQPPSNPPQDDVIEKKRKVYYTSEEIWEDYKKLLPAWPAMSERARRMVRQMFMERDMSSQRQWLQMRRESMGYKNNAA